MSPNDAINLSILHSNRSFAFLKLEQFYYANEDSEKAIELNPNWPKGYFRKGEVLFAAGQYDSALLSYAAALSRQPNDMTILEAAKKSAAYSNRDKMMNSRIPWVFSGVGIIIGVSVVLLDQLATKSPTIRHPALMVFLVMIMSGIFFGAAKIYRTWSRDQRKGLLDPPLDLLEEFLTTANKDESVSEEQGTTKQRTRYTKAQARQRFKKGKL